MKLFQYAIIYQKKEKEAEPCHVIVEVKTILAKDEKEVGMRAAREIPEKYLSKLDQVEIAIRPF